MFTVLGTTYSPEVTGLPGHPTYGSMSPGPDNCPFLSEVTMYVCHIKEDNNLESKRGNVIFASISLEVKVEMVFFLLSVSRYYLPATRWSQIPPSYFTVPDTLGPLLY